MSQLAVGSRKQTIERQNWTELTPQALYDKCHGARQQPVVELASRSHQPVSRSRSRSAGGKWIITRSPCSREIHARAAWNAGRRIGALQPHQPGLSPAQRIHERHPRDLGRDARRRARVASRSPISPPSSASTNRCRFTPAAWACSPATISKAPAAWACRWWRSACSTTRAISSSISMAAAYQQEEYLDTQGRKPADGARPRRRRQADHGAIDTRDGGLLAKVWLMQVGRVQLYLLDCDVEGNSPEDRELTSRLYGGDHRTRIRQELVLGVGGVKRSARWASRRACIT